MRTLTPEELQEVKRLAALFFSPKKVAAVLEVSAADFTQELCDDSSLAYMAYYGAFYLSEAEFRQKVIEQAKQGSSPAQSMAAKFIEEARADMV